VEQNVKMAKVRGRIKRVEAGNKSVVKKNVVV
jgi:hypothetical protein